LAQALTQAYLVQALLAQGLPDKRPSPMVGATRRPEHGGDNSGCAPRKIRLRSFATAAFVLAFGAHRFHAGSVASVDLDTPTEDDAQCALGGLALCGIDGGDQPVQFTDSETQQQPAFASGSVTEGAAALANGAAQAAAQLRGRITEGSAALMEVGTQLAEQHAALIQAASQAATQLAEQRDAFAHAASQAVAQLVERQSDFTNSAGQAAAQLAERLGECPAVLKAAAGRIGEKRVAFVQAASQAAAQLAERQSEITNSAGHAAAQFAERLGDGPAVLKAAAGRIGEQLAERQFEIASSAGQAAAQFAERLVEGPAVLKAAAGRLGDGAAMLEAATGRISEQQAIVQQAASRAMTQLADWQTTGQAAMREAAAQAAGHLSEQQDTLNRMVAMVGMQLSEGRGALAQAASQATAQLTRSAAGGQEAFRQAVTAAIAQLDEHEALLQQLAELQATLSPSAGRIAAQLAELQHRIHEFELEDVVEHNRTWCRTSNPTDTAMQGEPCVAEPANNETLLGDLKPYALPWLLAVRKLIQNAGLEVPAACVLFCVLVRCVFSTVHTIVLAGGADPADLAYGSFVQRVAWWLVLRVCLGGLLLLLSDFMADGPLQIPRYDVMGWPMWSTLLPLTTQLCFFVPAAAVLNTAVACRVSHSAPESRRFYCSLSREVHTSIVGCFVSDWLLFPTNLVFLGHHLLGLGIIFGVWSMVLGEARLLSRATARGSVTAINFWWVTGLSVATMEASSFVYNLHSVMNFGAVLNLSFFAVYSYSNLLALMCVLSQHPWGARMKVIWVASSSHLCRLIEMAQAAFPQLPPFATWGLSSKAMANSVLYLWKLLMVTAICVARHYQMWIAVGEQTSSLAFAIVGTTCVLLAGASVWRLKHFEGLPGVAPARL